MRSGTSHYLDEIPIFLCRFTVSFYISDQLAIGLCRCIKTKGKLNILIFQITVNGLGASDYLYAGFMRCHIFGQYRCIGIGIITANDNNGRHAMLPADLHNKLKLLLCLQLGPARTDNIKSACISISIDICIIKYKIVILQKPTRSAFKAKQDIVRIRCLQGIIEAADNIVAARCLSSRKDHTDNMFLCLGSILSFMKDYFSFSVSVRKKCLNLLLISCTLRYFSLNDTNLRDTVPKHPRKLWLISVSRLLKW